MLANRLPFILHQSETLLSNLPQNLFAPDIVLGTVFGTARNKETNRETALAPLGIRAAADPGCTSPSSADAAR